MIRVIFCTILFIGAVSAGAQDSKPARPSIKIMGKAEVSISQDAVYLSDIASITSPKIQDDEAIMALGRIKISDSPEPGQTKTIVASAVLSQMRGSGVQLSSVGYAFPRVMKVHRAGRLVSHQEIEDAVREELAKLPRDTELKSVHYDQKPVALPDYTQCKARLMRSEGPGVSSFEIEASNLQGEKTSFVVRATFEEWTTVPIAARPITSGSVISPLDITQARMSLRSLPSDAASELGQVIGQETSRSMGIGEIFRMNKISIPPIITSGERVILRYSSALLEATTDGTALEDGLEGDIIKIRNNSTRRIVTGKVIERGLVGVEP